MLSNILHQSSNIHGTKPFIKIYHHQEEEEEEEEEEDDDDKNIITYQEAYLLSKKYQQWIQNIIIHCHSNILQDDDNDDIIIVEIVIAYLSYNTPELLLSILGCMDLGTLEVKGRPKLRTKVRIAMLNTRWSAKEIGQALSVKEKIRIDDGREQQKHQQQHYLTKHMTIIIYGDSMLHIAKEACCIINNNNDNDKKMIESYYTIPQNEQNYYHKAISFALPKHPLDSMEIYYAHGQNEYRWIIQPPSNNNDIRSEALILFTSGTTSGPKGVILSHLSLWIQAMAKTQQPCCYDEHTKMLATTVPFFHVGGINSALAVMIVGGCLVFPPQRQRMNISFDPKLVLNTLECGVDTLVVVPAMIHSILNEVQCNHQRYNKVRLVLVGGQSLSIDQLQQCQVLFPNSRIVQTFACTEAGSSITFRIMYDPTKKSIMKIKEENDISRSVTGTFTGFPPQHIELAIFALKDNKPTMAKAKPFEIGAIGTKGPHVMNGYWKRGSKMKRIGLFFQQWLITNDLGYMDSNGGLYFCGRLNDVIRTGGETVFAPEVEAVLLQHPCIEQCAIFASPDERFGECVCAAIVLKKINLGHQGAKNVVTLENIRQFCQQKSLTGYKRPKKLFILDDLPRNSSGKILKNDIKQITIAKQSRL